MAGIMQPRDVPTSGPLKPKDARARRSAWTSASAFLRDTAWLIRDSVGRYPWQSALVVVLHFLGQVFQIRALVWAVSYAGRLDGSKSMTFFGKEWIPSQSYTLLAIVGASVLVTLVVSSVLVYGSQVLVARLVRRYEATCTMEALRAFASSAGLRSLQDGSSRDRGWLLGLVTKDTRYCGRALNDILRALVPALTGLGALGVMFYLDWVTTLIVLFVMILVAPLYLLVHRRGSKSMKGIQRFASRDTIAKSEAIQRLDSTMIPVRESVFWLRRAVDGLRNRAYMSCYEGRLRAAYESLFIGDLHLAMFIFLVLVSYGWSVLGGRAPRLNILYYVVMLRYALGSLRALGKHSTNLVMFHSCFQRYVRFMQELRPGAARTPALPDRPAPLLIEPRDSPEGSLSRLAMQPGRPVSVIGPFELSRLNLPRIVAAMLWHHPERVDEALQKAAFAKQDYPPIRYSLRESLGAENVKPDGTAAQQHREAILRGLRLDRSIKEDEWYKIPAVTRFLCSCFEAIDSDSQWMFLDQKGFQKLSPPERQWLLNACSGRYILVFWDRLPDKLNGGVSEHYAVIGGGRVGFIGRCDEYESVRPRLLALAQKDARRAAGSAPSDDEADFCADDVDSL